MKCLLVDDSKTMRTIQRRILSTAMPEMEFQEAGDGVEALAVIAATPGGFTMMMVDWNMPNMDGITLVKKVRETDKRTMIIMATTESEKTNVLEALKAGVNNYVVKPFTPESLLERVKQTLSKARAA
jgi:two-component system, chemotaxis family, chemotaxis protein CheY